jgi:hypothetical protein
MPDFGSGDQNPYSNPSYMQEEKTDALNSVRTPYKTFVVIIIFFFFSSREFYVLVQTE